MSPLAMARNTADARLRRQQIVVGRDRRRRRRRRSRCAAACAACRRERRNPSRRSSARQIAPAARNRSSSRAALHAGVGQFFQQRRQRRRGSARAAAGASSRRQTMAASDYAVMRVQVRPGGARGRVAATRSGITLEAIRSSVSKGCDSHGRQRVQIVEHDLHPRGQSFEPVARPPRSARHRRVTGSRRRATISRTSVRTASQ